MDVDSRAGLRSNLRPQTTQLIAFMSASIREREDDDNGARSPKRTKTTEFDDNDSDITNKNSQAEESILPPSHILLGLSSPSTTSGGPRQLLECDVGISEYISRDLPPIRGIIKQRQATLPTPL